MTLTHYSDKPVPKMYNTYQLSTPRDKPIGLWVSVDGEDYWKSWCESEDFNTHRLSMPHRVELSPTANILHLKSPYEIRGFSAKYRHPSKHSFDLRAIEWSKVARDYQGIIIAPYQLECHYSDDIFWYCRWDCASGCIWNVDAVLSISPLCESLLSGA